MLCFLCLSSIRNLTVMLVIETNRSIDCDHDLASTATVTLTPNSRPDPKANPNPNPDPTLLNLTGEKTQQRKSELRLSYQPFLEP